jgi:hypothetical protein
LRAGGVPSTIIVAESSVACSRAIMLADPRLCPHCSKEMRMVALIDDRAVIERILRHLGLWPQGVRIPSGADPPSPTVSEPWLDDPFPDYDTEPVRMCAHD